MVLDQEALAQKYPPRNATYAIASCARCGERIEKGTRIELWESGPKYGNNRRWVHVGCEPVAAPTGAPASVDATQVEQMVSSKVAQMIEKLDLSGLEAALGGVKDTLQADFNKQLLTFCEQMAGATSESCNTANEIIQKELGTTLTRVQEMVEAGVKHVHVLNVNAADVQLGEDLLHPAFSAVLELAMIRETIFLPGPAGCGKSHLAKQVNDALNAMVGQECGFAEKHKFGFISCSAGMSEGQLLGRLLPVGGNGEFKYVRSEFVRCYEEGGVFLLDELDAADSNVLLVLNAALANDHMAIPNRPEQPVAYKHPDFVLIAAANTFGRGSDRLYVGRTQLDESTLDRFRIGTVEMDYDPTLEARLCPDKTIREELQRMRAEIARNKLQRVVSTRFLAKAYSAHKRLGKDLNWIKAQLCKGWSPDEVRKIGG